MSSIWKVVKQEINEFIYPKHSSHNGGLSSPKCGLGDWKCFGTMVLDVFGSQETKRKKELLS